MIDFYYWPTGNGMKIAIALEELGLPHTPYPLNIRTKEHHTAAFAALNPHRRTPVIVDHAPFGGTAPQTVVESGAILLYLAGKTGALLPPDESGRWQVTQWLFWHAAHQASGLGLLQRWHEGEAAGASDAQRATARDEAQRLYRTLDDRLQGREHLADSYSIADIAVFPWIQPLRHHLQLSDFPNLQRWQRRIAARPAVRRAYERGLQIAPQEKALQFSPRTSPRTSPLHPDHDDRKALS